MDGERCFTVWPSYYEAIQELSAQQRLDVYDAMFTYGILGEEPDFLTDPVSKAVFAAMRPNIESSVKKHMGGRTGAKRRYSKAT